uniref:Uncharacterized protein n=1 Tax=Aplanochytrium stocchinoi TaxID=215587 RepID=A0A7S3LJH3_9STRA
MDSTFNRSQIRSRQGEEEPYPYSYRYKFVTTEQLREWQNVLERTSGFTVLSRNRKSGQSSPSTSSQSQQFRNRIWETSIRKQESESGSRPPKEEVYKKVFDEIDELLSRNINESATHHSYQRVQTHGKSESARACSCNCDCSIDKCVCASVNRKQRKFPRFYDKQNTNHGQRGKVKQQPASKDKTSVTGKKEQETLMLAELQKRLEAARNVIKKIGCREEKEIPLTKNDIVSTNNKVHTSENEKMPWTTTKTMSDQSIILGHSREIDSSSSKQTSQPRSPISVRINELIEHIDQARLSIETPEVGKSINRSPQSIYMKTLENKDNVSPRNLDSYLSSHARKYKVGNELEPSFSSAKDRTNHSYLDLVEQYDSCEEITTSLLQTEDTVRHLRQKQFILWEDLSNCLKKIELFVNGTDPLSERRLLLRKSAKELKRLNPYMNDPASDLEAVRESSAKEVYEITDTNELLLRQLRLTQIDAKNAQRKVDKMKKLLDHLQMCLHEVYCEMATSYVLNSTGRKMRSSDSFVQ